MSDSLLEQIQTLQFTDRSKAEALLRDFVCELFPDLNVIGVELRPQAVSLNSFNGFLIQDSGERLFFKTHVEQDNIIDEYYNATLLADAGYDVIQPLHTSTQADQQLLIYPLVTDPSVFDVARDVETGKRGADDGAALTQAQNDADDHLYKLYEQTLQTQTAEEAAAAPVHQLFYHRLTGGRLERFYGDGQPIELPDKTWDMADIRRLQWTVNGAIYDDTLQYVIDNSTRLLNPKQAGLSVVGHGDAHNGNVFIDLSRPYMIYFDPAFAGRHHPLLDLTKPLFHNVFAMWMYFPEEEAKNLEIQAKIEGENIIIAHNYKCNDLRKMFLNSKIDRVLTPILRKMKYNEQLRDDWRAYLKAALFCCPFLTLNLRRFPPKIALLGLSMAIQMGSESRGDRSLIDQVLDRVEQTL